MTDAKANVNVNIDADVNETASRLLAGMGIDQAAAIDMFFRQIIKVQGLPFQMETSLDEQLTAVIRKRDLPAVRLECDENGELTIDRDKHPDIYDWLVNG